MSRFTGNRGEGGREMRRAMWLGRRHVLFVLAGLAAACSIGAQTSSAQQSTARPATAAVFPAAEWERIDRPVAVGWSAQGLAHVRAKLSTLATTGFMAVMGGGVL